MDEEMTWFETVRRVIMRNKPTLRAIPIIVLICLLIFSFSAGAQDTKTPYSPITKVDLGVSSLELDPGESYTFQVTYEPEEPAFKALAGPSATTASSASIPPHSR